MGELTRSSPTPSTFRGLNKARDDKGANSDNQSLLRPFLDNELWNDLACTIYDLRDDTTHPVADAGLYDYILPFEMPVDGRVEFPHYAQFNRLGDGALTVAAQVAIVKRGATPSMSDWVIAEGILGLFTGVFIPFFATTFIRLPMAGSGSLDVKAGKWDLWIEYNNFSGDPINIEEFYVSLRRGRKPTA